MTKDIERVAKALMMDSDTPLMGPFSYRACARAAIASLLPPSDAMVEAAAAEIYGTVRAIPPANRRMLYGRRPEAVKRQYRLQAEMLLTAAINAALGTKP